MRKLAIRFFNDVPVVVLTVIESIIIFAATMVAKPQHGGVSVLRCSFYGYGVNHGKNLQRYSPHMHAAGCGWQRWAFHLCS